MNETEMPLKSRRKPVQQRAQLTRAAILEAFVRLLVEKGYQALTMRDIALVAGVGLGTLYEHFPGKASIAAYSIRERFCQAGAAMRDSLAASVGQTVQARSDAMLTAILRVHAVRPQEWSALIFLERQISGLDAYRDLYLDIVAVWRSLLDEASDAAGYRDKRAEVLHAMVYGLLYQTLMLNPQTVTTAEFAAQLSEMVNAYLKFTTGSAI